MRKLIVVLSYLILICCEKEQSIEIFYEEVAFEEEKRIVIIDSDTCVEILKKRATDTVLMDDFEGNYNAQLEAISCYFVDKYNSPFLIEPPCLNLININERSPKNIEILLSYIFRNDGKWSNYFVNHYETYWDDYLSDTTVIYTGGFHQPGNCIKQRNIKLLKDLRRWTTQKDKIYIPLGPDDPCKIKNSIHFIFEFDIKTKEWKLLNKWLVEFWK